MQECLETTTDSTEAESLENERIETVLIKVNSSSSAFQVWIMATFYSFHFFLGLQAFTFLFMFISPDFFYHNKDGQGSRMSNAKGSRSTSSTPATKSTPPL